MRDDHLYGIAHRQRYEQFNREFRWNIPDHFNFGTDVVDAWAAERDGLAILWENDKGEEAQLRYSDVARAANRLANVLKKNGIRQGDRVIVMMPRIPEWQISMVACFKLGAIVIPCIEMLTERDMHYRVTNSEARAIICRSSQVAKFKALERDVPVRIALGAAAGWLDFAGECAAAADAFSPALVAAEDPVMMYYTSGSTGHPKGVLHAARAIYAWRMAAIYWIDLTPEDRIWCTADTGWSKAGTSVIFGPWSCGSCAFIYDGPFAPAERLRLLAKHRISVYCAPATELNRLVAENIAAYDLSALRHCISAGEAMNPAVATAWKAATGVDVYEAYGQTEALMMVLNYPSDPLRYGSMGRPIPGMDCDIVDDSGVRLGPGVEGHVAVRMPHPQMMLGYWKDPEKTESTMVDGPEGRWYLSGDRGSKDADGYYWYAGRADDVIGSAGYRIGPLEVENALLEHESVLECAVVGSPDKDRGEIVKAFVVLKPGFKGDDALAKTLQDHVKAVTAPYKYPRAVEFIAELPKTVTGKIRRRSLRDLEVERAKGKG